MTKFNETVIAALAVVFAASPAAVSKIGKDALVAAGAVPAGPKRGRNAETVGALLLRFAGGEDLSGFLIKRLIEAGFVTTTGSVKVTPGAGRPSFTYGLTGKGRSRAAILAANAARKAAKVAKVA